MKRIYAFESDVSADVKDLLEKVEDAVDEKCETVEDCEKLKEKIEKKEDEFNEALKGMADAAQDCKDGKCDKSELKDKLDPHVSCLKTIAKDIGVATESDIVSDVELQDVKDYIEGAKEIVEAKVEELEDPDGEEAEKNDDDDDDDTTDSAGLEGAAFELFGISKSDPTGHYTDDECIKKFIAANANDIDKSSEIKQLFKDAIKDYYDFMMEKTGKKDDSLTLSVVTISGCPVIVTRKKADNSVVDVQWRVKGAKRNTAYGMKRIRAEVAKIIKKESKNTPAGESYIDGFDTLNSGNMAINDFISSLEGFMIEKADSSRSPYMFE